MRVCVCDRRGVRFAPSSPHVTRLFFLFSMTKAKGSAVAARMLRVTWVLIAECAILTTLSLVLFLRPADASASRVVAIILAAFALFVAVMASGQQKLLSPFVKRVGICKLCAR